MCHCRDHGLYCSPISSTGRERLSYFANFLPDLDRNDSRTGSIDIQPARIYRDSNHISASVLGKEKHASPNQKESCSTQAHQQIDIDYLRSHPWLCDIPLCSSEPRHQTDTANILRHLLVS